MLELAATEISYGPVADSMFELTPPAKVKIEEVVERHARADAGARCWRSAPPSGEPRAARPPRHQSCNARQAEDHHPRTRPGTIVVLEAKARGAKHGHALEGLPQVKINSTSASELRTALGTVLSFERSGVRYVLAGSVKPGQLEALARGL